MDAEFQALQKHWYKKLASSGFRDIECMMPDGDFFPLLSGRSKLIETSGSDIPGSDEWDWNYLQTRQEYYDQCGEFLHNYKFKNDRERLIFELHSEGVPFRDICKRIGVTSAMTPYRIVSRLRLQMFYYFYYVQKKQGSDFD